MCFQGLIHNREKQEIKTVRIVKRESERRQRDRGDRTGNIGIPLTNGLQAPGGAKRLCDDDLGGSQKFEVISSSHSIPVKQCSISFLLYISLSLSYLTYCFFPRNVKKYQNFVQKFRRQFNPDASETIDKDNNFP